jgi:hypothetical protein
MCDKLWKVSNKSLKNILLYEKVKEKIVHFKTGPLERESVTLTSFQLEEHGL